MNEWYICGSWSKFITWKNVTISYKGAEKISFMEKERYEIVRLIGKGLVGGVYEAKDAVLSDRGVAIRRFFNMEEGTNRSDWEEGFLEVAQQLSGVQHPGIVTVFDVGVDDEGAFVVAQLLEGKTFGERLKDGAINEWDVYVTIEGILDALVIAHEAGFMHGSLDPSSIIRVPRASGGYRNVIVDLGLTRLARLIEGQESSSKLMAQPAIMAPEQFDGSAPTVTSDLYMLGQFAYMCLIGGHPFAGQTMEEAAISHKEQELKRLEEYDNGVSKEFSDWVHSLIQKNPADRPQSAEEALKSLPKLNKPIDENIQITSPMTNGLTTSVVQVTPTSHQSGAQQLQTVGIAATVPTSQEAGEKQEQLEPVAEVKKSNKTALIAICSTLCLLFVGLLVLIVMKVNSSNDEVVDNKKSDALKDLSYSTTMTNVAFSGKFISNKSLFKGKKFSRVKKIRIGSNVLDYILMNGRVVDDYRIRNIESNKYFSNVELNKQLCMLNRVLIVG